MMMAMLHSNRQLRTERDGDTEKGCQKPALQQKTTDDDDDDDDDDGIIVFTRSFLALLVTWYEGNLACKNSVGILVVVVWVELCTGDGESNQTHRTLTLFLD